MSPRTEDRNNTVIRDGRRQELRELLVSAAHAARQTRQKAVELTNRARPEAVRERMSMFLAAAR